MGKKEVVRERGHEEQFSISMIVIRYDEMGLEDPHHSPAKANPGSEKYVTR